MSPAISKLTTVLLVCICLPAVAGTWTCEGGLSNGNESPVPTDLTIRIQANIASIKADGYTYTTGYLTGTDNVLEWAEEETASVLNERITTIRRFRFDQTNGELVFFDLKDKQLLIRAECTAGES